MDKLKIALEVIEDLMREKKAGLNSEHYSTRYSAEIKVDSISRVKTMLEEKIEDEESDIDEIDMIGYISDMESFE